MSPVVKLCLGFLGKAARSVKPATVEKSNKADGESRLTPHALVLYLLNNLSEAVEWHAVTIAISCMPQDYSSIYQFHSCTFH